MATCCSHVLIWVSDLHRAVRDYRRLGFNVEYATSEQSAQHAHIWFNQGPIIEILTTPPSARWFKWPIELIAGRGSGRRMTRWPAEGEGFCDVAVVTQAPTLDQELKALRQEGIRVGRAIRWRRARADGQRTSFQFAYPENDRLPFLVSPYDPPQHPKHVQHANGAKRLTRVWMRVHDQDRAALRRITCDDPTFQCESGSRTELMGIEIEGLEGELDSTLLHGARVWRKKHVA